MEEAILIGSSDGDGLVKDDKDVVCEEGDEDTDGGS